MSIQATDLIFVFQQALDEQWGYIYGASGYILTQKRYDKLTGTATRKYARKWIGKHVADCSGLFAWAFSVLGGSIYHGSNTIWKKYCSAQGILTLGQTIRPGTAVFLVKNGKRYHIGLYVGRNTCIEARSTRDGVVTSRLSHWDEWGELNNVTYTTEGEIYMTTLQTGSKGAAVKDLQNSLLTLGYDLPRYGADGSYGNETVTAVRQFQEEHGLDATGVADEATITVILAAVCEQRDIAGRLSR